MSRRRPWTVIACLPCPKKLTVSQRNQTRDSKGKQFWQTEYFWKLREDGKKGMLQTCNWRGSEQPAFNERILICQTRTILLGTKTAWQIRSTALHHFHRTPSHCLTLLCCACPFLTNAYTQPMFVLLRFHGCPCYSLLTRRLEFKAWMQFLDIFKWIVVPYLCMMRLLWAALELETSVCLICCSMQKTCRRDWSLSES